MAPVTYVVYDDESELTLGGCFIAAQSASANSDISDRTLVAAWNPVKHELVVRSAPECIFFPRRVSLIKNHVAIRERV